MEQIKNSEDKEKKRIEYLLEKTNKADLLEMPEFFYNPKEFKRMIEEEGAEFGGFKSEEERREIARYYNSMVPKYFYLLGDYIFVAENLNFPQLASVWDKEQKELEKRNDWEWYN